MSGRRHPPRVAWRTVWLGALLLGLCAACGSDGGGSAAACVPGRVEACPCVGGGQGTQTCVDSGQGFGPCLGCGGAGDVVSEAELPGARDDVEAPADAVAVPDMAAPPDGEAADAQVTGEDVPEPQAACEPCGYGTVKGVICAPNEQVFIAAGHVSVQALDCDGSAITRETTSAADGSWTLEQVPCGLQTVVIKAGSFEKTFPVQVAVGKTSDHSGVGKKQCFKANATPIAVFWGQWDHQHQLLDALGLEYNYFNFEYDYFNDVDPDTIEALQVLRSPEKLAAYKILFFNCGSAALGWVNGYPEIAKNLRAFVLAGGSLYASDLSWAYLEAAFPDAFDFYGANDLPATPMANDGPQQAMSNVEVEAFIVDPQLAAYVGVNKFVAKYGPGPLIAVDAVGPEGSIPHVRAGVKFEKSGAFGGYDIKDQPVVVSHTPAPGAGRVVYTTFHNDEQADAVMTKILNYLVFIL